MLRLIAAVLLAICCQPSSAANLSVLYRDAVTQDARYASARADFMAVREKYPQARAGLLPNADLAAFLRRNHNDTSVAAAQDFTSRGFSLSLVQPVYRKQNFDQVDLAKLQISQAEFQLASAKQDLILRLAQAYFDVLEAGDELEYIRAQKKAITEQLAQAKRSFEVGTATITDTDEAQARFDLVSAQEIAALNTLEIRRRALETIIGGPAPVLDALKENMPLTSPEPNRMEDWVDQAETANLQLLAAQAGVEIAGRNVSLQKGGHYPTLDLAASYADNRNQGFGPSQLDSRSAVVGLEFNLPIYSGGFVSSLVREAEANRQSAEQNALQTRRQAGFDTRQSFLNVTNGEAQVRALIQALASSQKQLESTQLGVEVGVRTAVDLLNARQQLFAAKRDLAAARYGFLISGLQLKAAAGTLSEADLGDIDQMLIGR
jgi:outer membrane protein